MKHSIPAAALAASFLLVSSGAFSQTATGDMGVSMTVAAECTLSTEALGFGPVGIIDTAVEATADITIQCTQGSPYQISLSVGAGGAGASVANRIMTGTVPGSTANYSLYQDDAYQNVWGTTPGDNTVDSIAATGGDEVHTVFGQVFAGQNVPAGAYSDTVTATITYGSSLL